MTDWHIHRLTHQQTNIPTDQQTNRPTDPHRLTDGQMNRPTDWQTDIPTDLQTHRPHRQTKRLIDQKTERPTGSGYGSGLAKYIIDYAFGLGTFKFNFCSWVLVLV